jgi:hypothetical protein
MRAKMAGNHPEELNRHRKKAFDERVAGRNFCRG